MKKVLKLGIVVIINSVGLSQCTALPVQYDARPAYDDSDYSLRKAKSVQCPSSLQWWCSSNVWWQWLFTLRGDVNVLLFQFAMVIFVQYVMTVTVRQGQCNALPVYNEDAHPVCNGSGCPLCEAMSVQCSSSLQWPCSSTLHCNVNAAISRPCHFAL